MPVWFAAANDAGMTEEQIIAELPTAIRNRLVSEGTGAVNIVVPFDYRGASQTRELVTELEARLASNSDAQTLGLERATGFEVMSSFVSEGMLRDLNRSLLIALMASGILGRNVVAKPGFGLACFGTKSHACLNGRSVVVPIGSRASIYQWDRSYPGVWPCDR